MVDTAARQAATKSRSQCILAVTDDKLLLVSWNPKRRCSCGDYHVKSL